MKLLITTLTMIFISFGATGQDYTIEKMFKNCKPLQSSGFNYKSIPKEALMRTVACKMYFDALVLAGVHVCGSLIGMKQRGYNVDTIEFKALRDLNSNDETKTFPVIASFINFAENNTNLWKEMISQHKLEFLSTKFPCKIDK